jgi:hypothetical protein
MWRSNGRRCTGTGSRSSNAPATRRHGRHVSSARSLRRDCARQQALVRAAQRTIGLTAPAASKPEKNGKKRRKRRPTARALRAVARLKNEEVTLPTDPARASAAV